MNLKSILIFFVFLILSRPCFAEQKYKIFDNPSKAQIYLTESSNWAICAKGEIIASNDVLRVVKKNGIKILDCSTNRIYSNVATGTMTVSQIVKNSQNKSNSILKNLNTELRKSINAKENSTRYVTYGATSRGSDSSISYVDSLYSSIYSGLHKNGTNLPEGIDVRKSIKNDSFSLVIENHTDEDFFCQLICINGTESASFCYEFRQGHLDCLPLMRYSKLDLSPFSFWDNGTIQFFLIMSHTPIPTTALIGPLENCQEPRIKVGSNLVFVIPVE